MHLASKIKKSESTDSRQRYNNQIVLAKDGFYEAPLPWKSDRLPLSDNKELALRRLQSSTKRLEKIGKLEEYHQIMKEQLNAEIIEPVPKYPMGEVVHYISHQPVIKESAESTQLWIVYDCSAQASKDAPKDCLKVGPPPQPLLFDILLRSRMRPLCIIGDIKKNILTNQVKRRRQGCTTTSLVWWSHKRNIEEFWFIRVLCGSGTSPLILSTSFEKHVESFKEKFPETTEALLEDTYVDDIQSGGDCPKELIKFKEESTKIMGEGGFKLHKWHSNVTELNSSMTIEQDDAVLTYTDWTTGRKQHETKILSVTWNKQSNKITIDFNSVWKLLSIKLRECCSLLYTVFMTYLGLHRQSLSSQSYYTARCFWESLVGTKYYQKTL